MNLAYDIISSSYDYDTRDKLRSLVTNGELTEDDYNIITKYNDLCLHFLNINRSYNVYSDAITLILNNIENYSMNTDICTFIDDISGIHSGAYIIGKINAIEWLCENYYEIEDIEENLINNCSLVNRLELTEPEKNTALIMYYVLSDLLKDFNIVGDMYEI